MVKKLIIIRGPSGTGKSTIAQKLGGVKLYNWFEADMFMVNRKGEYVWDVEKLGHAHQQCHDRVRLAMEARLPKIIVSNTSVREREVRPYVELAEQFGYEVEIIRTPKPWDLETLVKRNVHDVPSEAVAAQIRRYVEMDGEHEYADF